MRSRLLWAVLLASFMAACAQDNLPELPSANQPRNAPNPDDADSDTFLRMGDRLFAEGQIAAASTMYKRAISMDPNNATGYARLGDLAWQAGQLNSAADLYASALQRDQTNPDALLGRARAMALAGENEAAMLLVNDLIRTHGASYQALALKAMLFDLNGDHDSAQTLFRSAIDRNPNDPNLISSLAYSNALEGDYRGAVDILRGLGEQQNTAAAGQYALADVYALSGQPEVGMELRRAAAGGQDVSDANRVFLERLPSLTPSQKARALYFRELPPLSQQSPQASLPGQTQASAPVTPADPVYPTQSNASGSAAHWVQIASFKSHDALEIAWYQINRAHPEIASRLSPAVQSIDIEGKGVFHRLYAGGYGDAQTAGDVCNALREADLTCVVVTGIRETKSLAQALASK